jgi:Fur family peroxide stress response transcriptional regulator
MSAIATASHDVKGTLADSGLRATPQREVVYQVLLDKRDHPTAEDVYARVRGITPSISLATVYNCLEALVQCGLVKQVNYERDSTRYCPNLREHAHFLDTETGNVADIELPEGFPAQLKRILPPGFEATNVELSFRGRAPSAPAS